MKSSSKCDVEISILVDGEETTESIPECLQGAFLGEVGTSNGQLINHVTLPSRYSQHVNNYTDSQKEKVHVETGGKMKDRERDLSTALSWIKQEMIIMKEQDKLLMRQFLALRSKIVQLRCVYEMDSQDSDLSQDEGSTYSLDDRDDNCFTLDTVTNGNSRFVRNKGGELNGDASKDFRTRTTSLYQPQHHSLSPKIVQLRCVYEMNSQDSDLSQEEGSTCSLDDRDDNCFTLNIVTIGNSKSVRNKGGELNGDASRDFRTRTTSLYQPQHHKLVPVTGIKWKDNEYI